MRCSPEVPGADGAPPHRDIEAALRSYRDLLGLREVFPAPKQGAVEHVELELVGFMLGLGRGEAERRVHQVDATPGPPSMSLVFWTEEVDRTFQRVSTAGTPIVQTPHGRSNPNRPALLRDPDADLIELVSTGTPWIPQLGSRGDFPSDTAPVRPFPTRDDSLIRG